MTNPWDQLRRKKRVWVSALASLGIMIPAAMSLRGAARTSPAWAVWSREAHRCADGDWGRLWYEPSLVELPPHRIQVLPFNPEPTCWHLELTNSLDIAATLAACGLTDSQRRDLMLTLTRAPAGKGWSLRPSADFILSLTPQIRAKLYRMLGHSPRNEAHVWPFRFGGESARDWLKGGNLSAEVQALVKSLIYRHGTTQYFSDLPLVLARYPSPAIYSNLFHTLSRESTLVAKIHVKPEDNVDALARYWGSPGREDEVRTLIRTLQITETCRDIPLTLLLPPFARDRIYRYWHEGDPEFPSCHYTAMNFFNEKADGRFTDLALVADTLRESYVDVTGAPYRLGDVILFMKNGTEAIHSCNYVADRIVFTRNGGNMAKPWMLTTLESLLDYYSYPDPLHVKVMRRRDMAGSSIIAGR